MKDWTLRGCGLALGTGGVFCLAPTLVERGVPTRASDLVQLAGPLRNLPVPFLWRAWRRLESGGRSEDAIAVGRWLTTLLPEREDLYFGFAWDLAFGLQAVESGPAARARHLSDALLLLEEGRRSLPDSPGLPSLGAFLLAHICGAPDDPEAPARAREFEALTGREPTALALRLGQEAVRAAPGITSYATDRAWLAELAALSLIDAGRYEAARAALGVAIGYRRDEEPDRVSLLVALRDSIHPSQGPKIDADLGKRLRADPLFGRKADSWTKDPR